jgi:hypothetical protein
METLPARIYRRTTMALYNPWILVLNIAAILSPLVTIITAMKLSKQGFSFVKNRAPTVPKWFWIVGLALLVLFVFTMLFDLTIVIYP